LVTQSLVSPPAPARARRAALGPVVSALVHVVRIPIIQKLIDAPIRWLAEFIAEHVDKKQEGFRFFDATAGFPFVSFDQLKSMSANGERVLLLTHGVFSSLEGAFAKI